MKKAIYVERARGITACLAVAVLAGFTALAASPYTETFSDPNSGWQEGNPERTDGFVATQEATGGNPGGVLRLRWNPVTVGTRSAPPVISPDALVATGEMNTVHFIGDLDASEAWLIGFDVNAVHAVPDYMYLALHSGTNMITRIIMNAGNPSFTTNTWYSMRYTLLDPPAGFWADDTEHFDDIISNVTRVSIVVKRRGEGLEDYLIDNVFVDRLPTGSGGLQATVDGNLPQLVWHNLRAGSRYRIEAATDLMTADWITVADFVAGEDVFMLDYAEDAGLMYFRMIME